jgi:ribosomal protein S18 acetylase RimI-like enzyme
MAAIRMTTFQRENAADVVALQQRVAAVYPESPVRPGELYLGPAFAEGANVFCAWDEAGRLVGLAPLLLNPVVSDDEPYRFWADIKFDPAWAEPAEINEALLARLMERARETMRGQPPNPAELLFQYYPSQQVAIAFVKGKGATPGQMAFEMRRDLSRPLPEVVTPPGVDIRRWKVQTDEDLARYVAALVEVFPDTPMNSVEEWRYFVGSPIWQAGSTITAFAGDEIAGSVATYWDPAAAGEPSGYTEYIFVRAPWRKKGLGRALVRGALLFLKEHGRHFAQLEVSAENDKGLGLYYGLGYEIVRQSQVFRLPLAIDSRHIYGQ